MKLLRFFGGLLRGRFLRPEPAVVSPQSQSTLKLFIGHRPVSTAGRSVHIPCMTAADAAYDLTCFLISVRKECSLCFACFTMIPVEAFTHSSAVVTLAPVRAIYMAKITLLTCTVSSCSCHITAIRLIHTCSRIVTRWTVFHAAIVAIPFWSLPLTCIQPNGPC